MKAHFFFFLKKKINDYDNDNENKIIKFTLRWRKIPLFVISSASKIS